MREHKHDGERAKGALEGRGSTRSRRDPLRSSLRGLSYDVQLERVRPTASGPPAAQSGAVSRVSLRPVQRQEVSEPTLTAQLPHYQTFVRYLGVLREQGGEAGESAAGGAAGGAEADGAGTAAAAGALAAERVAELAEEGFDIRSTDVLERLQEQVLVQLGYEAGVAFNGRMNDYFAGQGTGPEDLRSPDDRGQVRPPGTDLLPLLDFRMDALAAAYVTAPDPDWLAMELAGLQGWLIPQAWAPGLGERAADGGIVGAANALELVVARAYLRFPLPLAALYEQEARTQLAATADPASALGSEIRPPPMPLHSLTYPLTNLVINAGHFVGGVVAGLESVGAAELGRICVTLVGDVALGVVTVPIMMGGTTMGAGEALGEGAAELYLILEDPEAFLRSLIEFLRVAMTPEGSELAEALGFETGAGYADQIAALADADIAELAFELGRLAGQIFVFAVLALLGIGALHQGSRVARWAAAFLRQRGMLRDGDRSDTGGAHGDGGGGAEGGERELASSRPAQEAAPTPAHEGLSDAGRRVLATLDGDVRTAIGALPPQHAETLLPLIDSSPEARAHLVRMVRDRHGSVRAALEAGETSLSGIRIHADVNFVVTSLPISDEDAWGFARRLAAGDRSVLGELGVEVGSHDSTSHEWGIGRRGEEIVLIRGEAGGVLWTDMLAEGVTPLAHTHPLRVLAGVPAEGAPIAVPLRADPGPLLPSAQDLQFMHHFGLREHRVFTPFGFADDRIFNPPAEGLPRLEFVITRVELMGPPENRMYRAHLRGFAGGAEVWTGDMRAIVIRVDESVAGVL